MNDKVNDLGGALPADTSVLEILKLGGVESTGWKITFAGPAHEKAVAWAEENSRKTLRREDQIRAAQANGRKVKPEERDFDDVRRENADWVISRIIDWTPIALDGKTIEFSELAARELLIQPRMGWAFNQMIEFLADERSFIRRSATS